MSPRGRQGRVLAQYLRRQVRAYSAFYRPALDRAFRQRGGRSGIDLTAVPLTSPDDVTDPTSLVLRPEYATISRYGAAGLSAKVLWARVTGRMPALNRTVIDPAYKPIHWTSDGGLLVGSSSADLDRLAEMGRRWLELAGLRPADALVSVVEPGPRLAFWELVLGARRAGLSSMYLPAHASAADVLGLRPTVLAGAAADLERILAEGADDEGLTDLRAVLVVGEPPDERRRAALRAAMPAPDTSVVFAWAPPGVRALWAECPGGTGLHTWSDAEVVEVVDGEVVWTALGWYGTVLVRLRTDVPGVLERGGCPACGRTTPRLHLGADAVVPARPLAAPASEPEPEPEPEPAPEPAVEVEVEVEAPPAPPVPAVPPGRPRFAAVLDGHAGVADWQAELRIVDGSEELLVFLAPADGNLAAVLQDLVRSMEVTQFVVLPPDDLAARREREGGERIVDLRDSLPA